MEELIKIDSELKHKLDLKSKELGTNSESLLKEYINKGLEEDKPKQHLTDEEIIKLLKHDNPSGQSSIDGMLGIVDLGYKTNAVDLKKNSYRR